MASQPVDRQVTNNLIRQAVRQASLCEPSTSPEAMATIMVLAVCREAGIIHADIPDLLRQGLARGRFDC